ncbi:MAG TPA: SHOCT domain-containing protein [Azospirillaceae bacterium]|nr:SHOCT domain-containing protein [Azospirillaceae bacterium]
MTRRPTGPRPAAAAATADSESGSEGLAGDADRRRSLAALKAMLDRGLMTPEEYERRRRAVESGG